MDGNRRPRGTRESQGEDEKSSGKSEQNKPFTFPFFVVPRAPRGLPVVSPYPSRSAPCSFGFWLRPEIALRPLRLTLFKPIDHRSGRRGTLRETRAKKTKKLSVCYAEGAQSSLIRSLRPLCGLCASAVKRRWEVGVQRNYQTPRTLIQRRPRLVARRGALPTRTPSAESQF